MQRVELSASQRCVLSSLSRGDKTMRDIAADWPAMNVQSLAGALSSLERRGFVGDVGIVGDERQEMFGVRLVRQRELHGLTPRGRAYAAV